MDVTVNGITGSVRWEGFRKGRMDNGPYVVIEYLVPFLNSDSFIDGVMGGIVRYGGKGGGVRNLPRQKCPTNPVLYATQAESDYVAERGAGTGLLLFEKAIVKVTYGVLTWPQFFSDDPGGQQAFPNETTPGEPYIFADCEIDQAGQAIAVPKGAMETVTAPHLRIDAPLTKWEGISTWRVTRHNYPNLPYKGVQSLLNKVNSTTFLGQDPKFVRFANAQTQLQMTSNGTRVQRFAMTFEVKFESTWNQVIRPDDLSYDEVRGVISTSARLYQTADLTVLLQ